MVPACRSGSAHPIKDDPDMKSPLRPAIVAVLFSASTAASAAAPVDAYNEYLAARIRIMGTTRAIEPDTATFLAQFLQTPTSPYSDLVGQPLVTNTPAWNEYLSAMQSAGVDDGDAALNVLRLQTGLTKARPGEEVALGPTAARDYRGREAAANAIKAGIDPDIFWKARDMSGTAITAAAGYALALQMLRDAVAANAPEDYARMAIKPDVLERYMNQMYPDNIPDADLRYLTTWLRGALDLRGAPMNGTAAQRLPAAYRLARVAAAYADASGYFTSKGYCQGNAARPGEPTGPDALENDRPLCFIAATDRGVQAWFRRQLRLDMSGIPIHENSHHGLANLARIIGVVLLFMDMVSFIETADAFVTERLAAHGDIDEADAEIASERTSRLSCRISP